MGVLALLAIAQAASADAIEDAVRGQPEVKFNIDEATLPEAILFSLVRRTELLTTTGGGDPQLSQQIGLYRMYAHEGRRKVAGQWLPAGQLKSRRTQFEEHLKAATDMARKARFARTPGGVGPAKKTVSPEVRNEVTQAIGAWPDDLVCEFLRAVLDLADERFDSAEQRFLKCIKMDPLLAAFHQGHGLALMGLKQPVRSLGEFIVCQQLRDDSDEPIDLIEEASKATPGTALEHPSMLKARELLAMYEKPKNRPAGSGGVSWLMPGRAWQGRGTEQILTPPVDRFICKQAAAMPIGEEALLVDKSVVEGAVLVYVQIAPGQVVRAEVGRQGFGHVGSYALGKRPASKPAGADSLPVAVLTTTGASFTPVDITSPPDVAAGASLIVRAANVYRQMGTEIRTGEAKATGPEAAEGGTLPGESMGFAFLNDKFAGFFTGRCDAQAEDCGKSQFVRPPAGWGEALLKSAKTRPAVHRAGGLTLKQEPPKKSATGQIFLVFAICEEKPEKAAKGK